MAFDLSRNSILRISSILLITSIILLYSCGESEEANASFGLIQSRILNTSCAISGCHQSSADPSFAQHGLVLEQSVAYDNLVNAEPKNANAKADGLLLVKPFVSGSSLLFHKISSNVESHQHMAHTGDYGVPMPLGLELLSEGQVEFIRRWIDAGAPQKGNVVPELSLLDDNTPQPENYIPLDPPASGIQVNIEKFEVAPQFEREFFVRKNLGNTEDIYVNRFEIKMRRNSHHFLLYDFSESLVNLPEINKIRDIRNLDGSMNTSNMFTMLYHIYIAGAQTPYVDFKFPEGVVLKFDTNASIDFNSHYVNKQNVPIDGEVNVNLHTIPESEVQKIAGTINWGNQQFSLPANKVTVITKTHKVERKTYIFSLTSHTHQLGEKFVIKIAGGTRNGEVVYTSTDWHHPLIVNYPNPIVLEPGEGLTSEITYNNTKNRNVGFGLTSEDEMGIIFGYYYED
jgi:hypothetical protein